MVVNGKITGLFIGSPTGLVQIQIPSYQAEWLKDLDSKETYSINIKPAKSKKSLNQNNLVWGLMTEIAKQLDMFPDANEVYLTIIKLAKIKTHYLQLENDEAVLDAIRERFRAFKIVDTNINAKGNSVCTVEVSVGMSQFNKNEMVEFIDKLLYFAVMNDVDTSKYERALRQ